MQKSLLIKWVLVLLLLFLSFTMLIYAKPILLPLTLAGLLAMLFMPLSSWLEKKHVSRGLSSLISVLVFLLILALVFYFFVWQITSITRDISEIERNVSDRLNDVQQFLYRTFGITPTEQNKMITGEKSDGMRSMITTFMGSLVFFVINFIITLVYMFMLMYFRSRIKNFILQLVSDRDKPKTERVIAQSSKAAQHYLIGFAVLVTILWVSYSIDFLIIGVQNAVFFAALCGMLEIIPFVGSLSAIILTILMVLSQGGGGGMVLSVVITYVAIQFTQFYIVQPWLLGGEVNINPLFAILVLLLGESVWGLGGMIIAIPLTGMIKIVFDNVEALHPYGYLLGKKREAEEGVIFKLLGKLHS